MTISIKNLRFITVFSFIIIGFISCEKDLENVGTNLVDENHFGTNKDTIDVLSYSRLVEKNKASGLGQYLLGVYSDADFGKINASVAAQLHLPANGIVDFGTNPHIEMVVLDIPYHATKEGNKTITVSGGDLRVPNFKLDSIIGNKDNEFQLNVFELGTFLNTLDPANPAQNYVYYTDKTYQKITPALYSGNFKPNENDTVLYVDRLKESLSGGYETYDRDTIKNSTVSPSIKLQLDPIKFKQLFVDKSNGTEFSTQEDFTQYFRGIYIEAMPLANPESSLLSLNMIDATVTIYYSNDIITTVDNVATTTRIKESMKFPLSGIVANKITRDRNGSNALPLLTNPNTTGESRLYVQGAVGSNVVLRLNDQIKTLRPENLLVNEASLLLYIDKNASSKNYPERLFIYNYDTTEHIKDLFTEGNDAISGYLEKDKDSVPYRYKFRITDYVSDILKKDNTDELFNFGVKVYSPSDIPTTATDYALKNYSWSPKGVVLHGNKSSDVDKRPRLEINYTKINN